jgi:uncharacterized protein (PEP-CTERM system associated)
VLSGLFALSAEIVNAEALRIVPTFGILETLTNNVNLTPAGSAQSDLVSVLTPGFLITESGGRTSLTGTVSVPVSLYARTGGANNQAYVNANVLGSVEAIEKFFFVEAAASASQQYFTPFGAQPPGLANSTENRYTTVLYRISPYVRWEAPGDIQYLVRDDNYWNNLSGAPVSGVNNAYTNALTATVSKQSAQLGWSLEYDRTSVNFNSQPPLLTQLARLRVLHSPDPQLTLSASGGYEDEDYTFSQSRGAIYGVGATWHPTDRTNVEALWEHRFFGASYLFNFAHRMPLSVWSLNASRNISSYPQQIAGLSQGVDVRSFLDQLFLASIPDPVQRAQFIDQYIRDHGLPPFLSSSVPLYNQQITLQTQANASFGLLGARNTIFFSAFYLRSQPITAAGTDVPGAIAAENNNTQVGGNVVWTHNLAADLTFALSGSFFRTESNLATTALGFLSTTRQGYVTATLTYPLSPNSSLNGGVRYQLLRNDTASGYTEAAAFVGFNYTFH